jgi:hypothetical protein
MAADATTLAEELRARDLAEHEAWLDRTLAEPNPLEPWLREELSRGSYHLCGFTWRLDPPTHEGFTVAK